jgi:hypothetical protein
MASVYGIVPNSRQFSKNDKGESTYSISWRVDLDDPAEDGSAAVEELGVSIGDDLVLSNGTTVYLNDISTSENGEDGLQVIVSLSYGKQPEGAKNPLTEPIKISGSFAQFTKIVDYDINGTPIVNSAKDPFTDPCEIDDSRFVLSITKNEASMNASLAYQFRDAVNATPFFGAGPGQVKVAGISFNSEESEEFGTYWPTTYQFHFDPRGFQKSFLDQGFREIVAGKAQTILVQGVPVTEAKLLNGQGRVLAPNGQPVFRTFTVYPSLPFTVFNF